MYCYIATRSTENVADATTKDDCSGSVKWYIEKVSQVSYSVYTILHYSGVALTHMAVPKVPSGGKEFSKICSLFSNNLFLRGVERNVVVEPMEEATCSGGLLVGSNMTWQPSVHKE